MGQLLLKNLSGILIGGRLSESFHSLRQLIHSISLGPIRSRGKEGNKHPIQTSNRVRIAL